MEKDVNYQKALDDLRSLYKREAKVDLDDEILHLFVRMNSLQSEMCKTIKNSTKETTKKIDKIEKIRFRSKWDYFVYGIGKGFLPAILIITIAAICFLIYNNKI